MFDKLERHWRAFKSDEPGRRFQKRYYQVLSEGLRTGRGPLRKILAIVAGSIVIAIGLFFIPAPGPGFLIVFIGMGMVTQESLAAARALDRAELTLRNGYRRAVLVWRRLPTPASKALLAGGVIVLLVAAAYGAYESGFLALFRADP